MGTSAFNLRNPAGPLDRALYSLFVGEPLEIPSAIESRDTHFAAFLAWDARNTDTANIAALARALFARGVAYVCAWGPGCERVHDIFDEVELELEGQRPPESVVMTTWHNDESLEEALWFFVYSSYPDPAYEHSCTTGIAAVIGREDWAIRVDAYLSDLNSLKAEVGL